MLFRPPAHYQWLAERVDAHRGPAATPLAEAFPLEAYQSIRAALMQRFPLSRGDHSWIRERAMRELLIEHGLPPDEAAQWAAAGFDHFMTLRHEVALYPEFVPMFDAWARSYRLGIITNGNVDVRRLSLDHHFDVIILAGELHASKPDPRPFLAAVALPRTQPHHARHVGRTS